MRLSRFQAISVGIVTLYSAAVFLLCRLKMHGFTHFVINYAASLLAVWFMVGLSALLFVMVRQHLAGASSSPATILREYFTTHWKADRFASALLPLLCSAPLIVSYNIFKQLYLPSAGFWFGRRLASADRALFGGVDAWQITHHLLASPWTTQVIDTLYHVWFLPLVAGVALCSFARPGSLLSWRYLTSYMLVWIVQGSFLAYLFPAAGPALRAQMHMPLHSPSFLLLNATLQSQDSFLRAHGAPGLTAVQYQHELISMFGSPSITIGAGISAMPSLHNGMAVLFACAAWSLDRRLGIAATVYAAIIWFGSIHLGWHYALDGIVACALTLTTWFGVGRVPALLERSERRPAPALDTIEATPALADAA